MLTNHWRAAAAATPPDWEVMSLRCASSGLAPEPRSDRWLAEACGPNGGCLIVEGATAEDALQLLALRLREL